MRARNRLFLATILVLVSSALSTLACAVSGTAKTTIVPLATLDPDQWISGFQFGNPGCSSVNITPYSGLEFQKHGWRLASDPQDVAAGFLNITAGECRRNEVHRGAVHFDLGSYHAGDVFRAYLHFERTTSVYGSDVVPSEALTATANSINCVGYIEVATAGWLTSPGTSTPYENALLPAARYLELPVYDVSARHDDLSNPSLAPGGYVAVNQDLTTHMTEFTADVTSQVQQWLAQGQNYGFVLVSVREDFEANDNARCLSYYDGFSLDLFKVA